MTWLTNSMRFGGGNPDPYWANVVFYLPMLAPGAAPVDVSPLARTVNVAGSPGGYIADQGILPGQTAWFTSLATGGNNVGLSVPAVAGKTLDGDFTIEGWFRPALLYADKNLFWMQANSAASSYIGPMLRASGQGEAHSLICNHAGGLPNMTSLAYSDPWTGEIIDQGRWHHIAMDRQAGTLRLYLDGQPLPFSGPQGTDWNGTLYIGSGYVDHLRGYIGPQRVTRGVARYAGVPFIPGFTPEGWMTHSAPDFSGTSAKFWRIRWTSDNGNFARGTEAELRTTSGGASINVSASALPTYTASSGTAGNPFRREWDTSTWAPTLPGWIKADLKASFKLLHFRLRNGSTANRGPKTWVLEGSNDDTSWTTLLNKTNETGWVGGETRAYHLPDLGAFRYYRLSITAVDGGTSPNLEEISLAPTADALSYITDPRQLGTHFDVNYGTPRLRMFDGNTSDQFWSSIRNYGWVGTRLLTSQTVNEITWRSVASNQTYTPSAGVVERSPDGLRWKTEWSFSGWTSWTSGEQKVSTRP